jgi:hypothetical protein
VITPSVQPVAVKLTVEFAHTVFAPLITGASGAGLVPMVMLLDAGEVPHASEQVAVYVPAPTCTLVPVPAFPDQVMVVPLSQPVADRVTFSVPHTAPDPEITGADGAGLVPMVMLLDASDVPQASEQVAVYVPAPTCTLVPVPAFPDHVIVPP